MTFNEISSRRDSYGGESAHIRIKNTELIFVPMKDGSIDIRANDQSFVANFSTDDKGGNRTLSVAHHDFINVREAT